MSGERRGRWAGLRRRDRPRAPDRGRRPRWTSGLRRTVSTVRFRVTALATLAVLVVLAATGVGLVTAQERLLTRNLEEAIEARADDLEQAVESGDLPPSLAVLGDDDDLAQVVLPSGRVVASSPNVAGRPAVADPPPAGQTQTIHRINHFVIDDAPFLLLSRRVEGPDGPAVLYVAAALDDITESTGILATSLTVAIPAVALLLGGLVWWLVGRTLRPVEAIRTEVADIGGTDLDRRVPEPATDDEIARLARTMNAMLDRVEDAARRQQRFVADASHELRSPLTRIRSEIEVDLAHPSTADAEATHRSVREEAIGLQRLVDDLLQLARSDAGAVTVRRDAVDLDDLVLRLARRLVADERVTIDTSGVTAAQVQGDADQLTRALGNLTDNAARHAAGTVTLTLTEIGSTAVLTVTDDGPGIPPAEQERVFDRFTRLDDARHQVTGGTGLGLAIARDIVERHGGTLRVDSDHHQGARFVVTLPLGGGA
jgi:signal transduction histidine kinase